MARETERLGQPHEVLLTREDGRLVELVIRVVGEGGELDPQTISTALRTFNEQWRQGGSRAERRVPEAPRGRALAQMYRAWEASNGEITPEYLAALAVAYAEVSNSPDHGSITQALADAIGRPPGTVKGHIVRARKEGLLSPAGPGQSGGEPTSRALDVLRGAEAWLRREES